MFGRIVAFLRAIPALLVRGASAALNWAGASLYGVVAVLGWLLTKAAERILRQGPPAIFAALIGGISGSVVTIAYERWPRPLSFTVGENVGFGYPRILFQNANRDGEIRISFRPQELERLRVCEYRTIRGFTSADLARNYLAAYPECFVVRQTGEREFEVMANEDPGGLLRKADGQFHCKCPPDWP